MSDSIETGDTIKLVLAVARLGEGDLRGWWGGGHALDRTGSYVLSGMFRRTWRSAALELDVSAATLMHNEILGRSTALHLFSDALPFRRWCAGWLAEQKTVQDSDPLLTVLEGWTPESAVSDLRNWAGAASVTAGEFLGEGYLMGRLSATDLADQTSLRHIAARLASAYIDQGADLVPPYFDLAR